jgi:hypothetical protein
MIYNQQVSVSDPTWWENYHQYDSSLQWRIQTFVQPLNAPDGELYCEYVLMYYVDDILARQKYDKVEEPEYCLGEKLKQKSLNGFQCWTMTSVDHYVDAAVKNVEGKIIREI